MMQDTKNPVLFAEYIRLRLRGYFALTLDKMKILSRVRLIKVSDALLSHS